jgi:flagellar hook-basal body complex protein FliE
VAGARAYSHVIGIMDVKLKPFDFNQAVARAGLRPDGQPLLKAAATPDGGSFRSAMADALKEVSASQLKAEGLQREVALDNPRVSLEETMVAMQKAQLGFTATLQVRNRLVAAYSEIMNMQV